jgi:hypothetical protein
MSVNDEQSIFLAMKQDGPLRVEDDVENYGRIFSAQSRSQVKKFSGDRTTVSKYRAVRDHVFDLLDINSFSEIPRLIGNPAKTQALQNRSYTLLANLYGITGDSSEIRNQFKDYALAADNVITYLKQHVLASYYSHIELSNEIETTHSPVDLLLIQFNPRFHRKIRFEAKRKLVLMSLAASIDQRERETDIEAKFASFLNFLNDYVWSPKLKIGEVETSYLHSTHNSETFACEKVSVLKNLEGLTQDDLGPREKITLIKRRFFLFNDRNIPIYVSVRKKDAAAKILKLLRKNEKNPAVAVDDELGLMAVLNSSADIRRFVRHLTRSALKAESIMVLEDISDTLSGGYYHGKSTGSNAKTPMLKFFARLGGMRVEFIIHTNASYLDYRYKRDVAHEEYEVRRLFDSDVASFLFPEDIYHLDMKRIREKQLASFRKSIES